MKKYFKKALACLTALAVSSASLALTPFAAITNGNDEYDSSYYFDVIENLPEGYVLSDVYGAQFTSIGYDEEYGSGGGFIFNSDAGWDQVEWGSEGSGKAITFSADDLTVTRLEDEPVFADDAQWAHVIAQHWWGGEDITVTSISILDAEGNVIITRDETPTPATDIEIEQGDSLSAYVGTEQYFDVSFAPDNAIAEEITWTSSDETVATVDEYGYVEHIAPGTATITATSENGLTDTCIITVLEIPTIVCDEAKVISTDTHADGIGMFKFIPTEDGTYNFYSSNNDFDTYGYVYDSDMSLIDSNDDGGDSNNFSVKCVMTAGETYYLRSEPYWDDEAGEYTVKVEKAADNQDENEDNNETVVENTVTYAGTIELDADSDDAMLVRLPYAELGIPTDAIAITNISFDCTWDCSLAGWAGGGGAVAFQSNAEDDGWVQIDMANVPDDVAVTTWTESLDFDPDGQDIAAAFTTLYPYVQIGWWWGSDPSIEISNIRVTYTTASSAPDTYEVEIVGDDVNANEGETVSVPFIATGLAYASSVQLMVEVPEGYEIEKMTIGDAADDEDYAIVYGNDRTIAAISIFNAISIEDGVLFTVDVMVPDTASGDYAIIDLVDDSFIFTDADGNEVGTDSATVTICDGSISVLDSAVTTTSTTTATTTTTTTTTVTEQLEIEETPITLHIEQQELILEELQAADYKVSVRVYCSGADYGIDSWNSKFLYFADCTPDGYDSLSTGNEVKNGGVMTINSRTGIKSDNFSISVGPLTNSPAGIVQVLGYASIPVYNDHWENENPEDITFYTMTFTLPEDTAEGDLFNIKWWMTKNLENELNDDVSLGFDNYITNWEDGFIKISDEEESVECVDITCATDYMGSFYADDERALIADDLAITATMSDGTTLDITADCAVEDDATPHSLYWDAYNAGNPTFEFTADFVYDGENEAVLAYLEGAGTGVVCSVTLNIGQRGDVSLDHVADNYDASMIQKYLVDYSSYETLLQFGVVTDEPILNGENNEFALILSDCDANGEHVAGDAALLLKWEADSAEYALVQEFAGNIVTPADLALLWADILA